MKRIISIIIAGLVGASVASLAWVMVLTPKENVDSTQLTGPIQYNCEQSSGTYTSVGCQCPKDPMVAGAPAYTYEEMTGYCMDSFGIPGGKLGETSKNLQEYEMLKNQ